LASGLFIKIENYNSSILYIQQKQIITFYIYLSLSIIFHNPNIYVPVFNTGRWKVRMKV